jgi:nucleoside-diphosphate-sugar epimerase
MTILVTGARGFVGSALVTHWRQRPSNLTSRLVLPSQRVGLGASFSRDLDGVDVVVHLAARVHIMADGALDPLGEYRSVNVDGTRVLAMQAAAAGVKRFVYVSSVKVNGEATIDGRPFLETDDPAPQDAYGVSKWEAEQCLNALATTGGMEIVVIRPPLVYGPGVKANFSQLMKAVGRSLPLPFGAINNQRSLVSIENLVDFIVNCATHQAAANQTFFVSDGCDLSTAELVRELARAMGVRERLLPVPASFLMAVGAIVGKSNTVQRLCSNLQVDISKARHLLGWTPPFSVEAGLRSAVSGVAD